MSHFISCQNDFKTSVPFEEEFHFTVSVFISHSADKFDSCCKIIKYLKQYKEKNNLRVDDEVHLYI